MSHMPRLEPGRNALCCSELASSCRNLIARAQPFIAPADVTSSHYAGIQTTLVAAGIRQQSSRKNPPRLARRTCPPVPNPKHRVCSGLARSLAPNTKTRAALLALSRPARQGLIDANRSRGSLAFVDHRFASKQTLPR
ncbi:hypothetical protein VDGL01_00604 [Verticillium dahliae]